MVSDNEDLNALKVSELQDYAKSFGIESKGRKSELIKRINDYKSASEAEASPMKKKGSKSPKKVIEASEVEETEYSSDSDDDDIERKPHKLEWMRTSRAVCNYLVMLELLFIFSYCEPIPGHLASEEGLPKGLFPPYTDKLIVLTFYKHLFYWFSLLVVLPIVIAVFFNWDENRKSHYSVLTFAVSRYCLFYLFREQQVFDIIFQYVPERLFIVTCGVSIVLAFWDRIKYINIPS
eukprot:Nk52_evm20s2640 gene=Nk52_evmTU20s2640